MKKRNITHRSTRGAEFTEILTRLTEFLREPFYLLLRHNIEVDGKTPKELAKIIRQSRPNVDQLYKKSLTVGLDKEQQEGGVK